MHGDRRDLHIHTPAANQSVSALAIDLRIAGLIAIAIAAYWPTSSALWHYWTDDLGYGGAGLLVAALAIWLLFRARDRVAKLPVQSEPWALALLVPCSIAALIFWRAGISSLQLLMWPALILLGVWSAFGTAVTRAIAVPVGFLYFGMPAWGVLAAPLQSLTLWIVTWLAPAVGVPATVVGTGIYLPGDMRFSVELPCSGVGFLAQGLAVAALLGELEQAPLRRRLRLLASMALVALVTNWIRVLTLIQVGYTTQMRHVLVTRHHLLFGYVLFVLALVVFVWVATRRALPNAAQTAPTAQGARSPAREVYVTSLVALVAAPILVGILGLSAGDQSAARELRLPPGRAEWRGPLTTTDDNWRPVFVGLHEELRGSYRDLAGRSVEAVAIGYHAQTHGRELVNEGNSLAGSGRLTALTVAVVDGGGRAYREEVVVDEHGQRSVIWSFYDIGGRPFVTAMLAQLWYGVHALDAPPYSALFAFRTACSPDCAQARDALADFVRAVGPQWLVVASARSVP
jgi:EpsI family protein